MICVETSKLYLVIVTIKIWLARAVGNNLRPVDTHLTKSRYHS